MIYCSGHFTVHNTVRVRYGQFLILIGIRFRYCDSFKFSIETLYEFDSVVQYICKIIMLALNENVP